MAQHKLNRDKQRSVREKIADMMREAEPTPFAVEGPCRAGIRSSLCLKGWGWTLADLVATEIVIGALHAVGAKRPTWLEGQPEYTQPGALPIERERCARCSKRLPEGHLRFCSRECGQNYHAVKRWERMKAEGVIRDRARRAVGCA